MDSYVEAGRTKSGSRRAESKIFLPSSPHDPERSINEGIRRLMPAINLENAAEFGVPYGNRTRVTAVKERRPIVIQRNFAAWIALYRTLRTHGNAYWTFNGRAIVIWESS